MRLVEQFLLYNLLPSIAIGLVSWIVVLMALRWLPIQDPRIRIPFLGVPVAKSALVLLGVGSIFPWLPSLFSDLETKSLSFTQLLPVLLLWVGSLLLIYLWVVQRARRRLLQEAYHSKQLAPRLVQSLQRVKEIYQQNLLPNCDAGFCYFASKAPTPQLRVSDSLRTPTALTEGGQPLIILPTKLVSQLTDQELDGVMAHELGHFVLRRNRWCSTTLLRRLILVSPAAAIVSAQLNHEEELVCDDIAASVVGHPDIYAEALVKSYRFARAHAGPITKMVRPLPQLLGYKAQLSTRVERLVQIPSRAKYSQFQFAAACLLWCGLIFLFFSSF